MGEIITKSFADSFHYCLTPNNKGLMQYRRWAKKRAHKQYRRRIKTMIASGSYDFKIPPFDDFMGIR